MLAVTQLRFLDFGPYSFELAAGECLGVSGPSGSGKSLLLRALADLDPHEGRVQLDGVAAAAMAPVAWHRRVGLLPSEPAWWGERVGDSFPPGEGPDLLGELGFEPGVLDWEVAHLSSGERQRLGLARLLRLQPEVLLLDEPTANLDAAGTSRVEALLAGRTRVWVSHDEAQLERVATRVLRLESREVEA